MADEKELEEFRAWKAAKDKEQLFGVLDEWAERSGLAALLKLGEDDGDDDDLAAATKKAAKGEKPKPPPKPKAEEEEPEPERTSIAARFGLVSN